jgi:16S rRNA (guanine527-N7)-methyltransferase
MDSPQSPGKDAIHPAAAPDPAADREAALRLVDVSRETVQRLDALVALLRDWIPRTNLIARSTLPHLWTRHVADSAQLLRLAPQARTWIDLGSGAGFPGLVIACALADTRGAMVHLVESIGKKCAFLREAVRLIDLPAVVHQVRIEAFPRSFSGAADVVTARAVAPLPTLLGLAAPLLKSRTLGLFPKGQDVAAELTEAAKYWNIDADIAPSATSQGSGILVVRRLQARSGTPARA